MRERVREGERERGVCVLSVSDVERDEIISHLLAMSASERTQWKEGWKERRKETDHGGECRMKKMMTTSKLGV